MNLHEAPSTGRVVSVSVSSTALSAWRLAAVSASRLVPPRTPTVRLGVNSTLAPRGTPRYASKETGSTFRRFAMTSIAGGFWSTHTNLRPS